MDERTEAVFSGRYLVKRLIQIGAIAATVLSAATLTATADNCREGMTATGECVDPGLAAAERLAAVILSQPNISYTAFPVLPAGDLDFRYPNQLIPNPQTIQPNRGAIRLRGH
jgi:hypothetical protein